MTKAARILSAGLAGGAALNVGMLATFRLLGFGWSGGGFLLDPSRQSPKLIAVWTVLEPLPLVLTNPAWAGAWLHLFGIVHAAVYEAVVGAWSPGKLGRAVKLASILLSQYAFWEFFTPYNLFGEPLVLVFSELAFWALVATAEALAIVWVHDWAARRSGRTQPQEGRCKCAH